MTGQGDAGTPYTCPRCGEPLALGDVVDHLEAHIDDEPQS